jgi:uncharacterized membrane protein YqjE
MHTPEPEADRAAAAASEGSPGNGLLDDIGQLGHGVKELMGAQIELASAELDLARSAFSGMMLAGIAAVIVGTGLGLTMLALLAVLLANWFGSWLLALALLAAAQLLVLAGVVVFLRRCLHWMSLPATRAQWSAMMRDARGRARRQAPGNNPP